MRIDDLCAEFKDQDFSVRISSWDKQDRFEFIVAMLTIMSDWGGSKRFWKEGEEENAIWAWVDCLENMSANSLIKTMRSIKSGNYREHNTSIPSNPMEFKNFCMTGNHVLPHEERKPTLSITRRKTPTEEEKSKQIKNEAMRIVWPSISKALRAQKTGCFGAKKLVRANLIKSGISQEGLETLLGPE